MRLILVLMIFCPLVSGAQNLKPDTAFVRASVSHAKNLYTQLMQGESDLYKGTDYPEYVNLRLDEDPFFMVNDWTDGWIQYGGELYMNVGVLYDICRDKVVIEHYYNHSMIELLDNEVEQFSMLNRKFVRLKANEGNTIKAGYYEELYKGNTQAYARFEKLLENAIIDRHIAHYFSEKTKYYIQKDGVYYAVKNKSSVLNVFEDRKREVRQFLKEKKILFNEDRAKAIALMTEFYDTTTNKQ